MSNSRWTSWAPIPNKPTVSVDIKQHFNFNCLLQSGSNLLTLFSTFCVITVNIVAIYIYPSDTYVKSVFGYHVKITMQVRANGQLRDSFGDLINVVGHPFWRRS